VNDLTPAGSPFDSIQRLRPDGSEYTGDKLHRLPTKCAYPGDQGHIYIIEFDNQTIKVGKASNPQARVRAHQSNAQPMGRSINRVWVSKVHGNYSANERALIAFGSRASRETIRAEYFVGLPFAQVLRFAKSLQYEVLDAAAVEARDKAIHDRWAPAIRAGLDRVSQDMVSVPQAYVDAAERWLSPIFGISPNPHQPRTIPECFAAGDPDEMRSCAERLAEIKNVPVEEILDMSIVDVLADLLHSMVETEISRMKIFAYENDRFDMVQPGRFFAEDVEGGVTS
jgi:hypothetical protein